MKKILIAVGLTAMLFAACGDDSSSSGPNEEPGVESSSSVERGSSSSEKAKSSSSIVSSSSKKGDAGTSSSVKSSSSAKSSSNVATSSSSRTPDGGMESSSSKELASNSSSSTSTSLSASSSSRNDEGDKSSSSVVSSSSADVQSSSSGTVVNSSSSAVKINCSALLEGKTGWSWDVPKECRFNPDIDYGTMTDSRDGKTYKTVKIGDQVWMAENLNFDAGQGGSGENKYDLSWCYKNEPKNCEVAGRLYTWAAAIDSVKLANDADNPRDCGNGKTCVLPDTVYGVCPPGWHLPNNAEWEKLFTAVGGQSKAGKALKSQNGWPDNGNGTDAFGFSALPAGLVNHDGKNFYGDDEFAHFWSASEGDNTHVNYVYLYKLNEDAYLYLIIKHSAFAVRCLKN